MPSQAGDWTWMSTVTRRDNRVTRGAQEGVRTQVADKSDKVAIPQVRIGAEWVL